MNKNNMILMASLLVSSALILPMSEGDKRAIRKELYANFENGQMNVITLSEVGLTVSEVIDRDIQVLSEHKNVLLQKMNIYKSRIVWDPAFDKVGAGFFGAVSVLAERIGKSAFKKHMMLTDNDELFKRTGDWFVDYIGYFAMSGSEYSKLVDKSASIKIGQNPEIITTYLVAFSAGLIALVSGGVCLKKIYNVVVHPRQLRASLEKVKNRFDRDQAIIVQLKEIKHTLAI